MSVEIHTIHGTYVHLSIQLGHCHCPCLCLPHQVTCALCGEKFDIFWSGDDDEWMCRAATYAIIDGQKRIVHVRCRPVSGEGKEWV